MLAGSEENHQAVTMQGCVGGTEQAQLLAGASGQASWRRRLLDQGLDDKELMKPRTMGKV